MALNVTRGGAGPPFLKTEPLQVADDMTWLVLPTTVRLFCQLFFTLALSLLALRLLAPQQSNGHQAKEVPPPPPPERSSPAPPSEPAIPAPEPAIVEMSTTHARAVTIVSVPATGPTATPLAAADQPRLAAPAQSQWRALAGASACVLIGVLFCVVIDRWYALPILVKVRSMGADSIIASEFPVAVLCTRTLSPNVAHTPAIMLYPRSLSLHIWSERFCCHTRAQGCSLVGFIATD